ncbi:MAG: adenylate/guanylate cyclase domain-containing protein [Myxococcota bacterium]
MAEKAKTASCKRCGSEVEEGFRFCGICGQSLTADEMWPGERRFVTIMFADVSGFSRMTERMDPEEVTTFLNVTFERIEEIIHRYGGIVDKYIGDCVMALFGAPKAYGNDAERACLTALEIMEAVKELNVSKRLPERLNMSIGVNAGTVIVGSIGGTTWKQNTVIGDAVNVAQRLQSIAQAGQIMTSRRVVRLCEQRIRFQSVGEFYVKGKSEPIPSYLVVGLAGEAEEERPEVGRRSIFVGRIDEQKVVKDTLDKTRRDGLQRVLAYVGEAGLGKRRLGEEGLKLAERAGFVPISCPALEFASGKNYGLVGSLVERVIFALGKSRDEGGENELSLEMILDGLAIEEPVRERIKELLAITSPSYNEMDEVSKRFSIYYAVRTLINLLCAKTPVHVLIPNIQWVDKASLSFLEHLSKEPPQGAIVWAFTTEKAESVPFPPSKERVDIELKALSKDETVALAQAISGNVGIEPKLADLLCERTGGNPFYLEELLSSLWYQRAIEQEERKLMLTADMAKLELPDSLTSAIAARIDALPAAARDVIRFASVIGRKFSTTILGKLSSAEELDNIISDLDEQGFIEHERGDPDDVWTFVHDLTRQVAYDGLLHKTRKELHKKIAEAIESFFDPQANPEWLAHHWKQAGNTERYLNYTLISAQRKHLVCQYDAAQKGFEEVIETLTQSIELEDEEQILKWTLSSYIGRGEVYMIRGEYDKAASDFVRGVDISRRLNDAKSEIVLEANQAKLYYLSGDLDFALIHGREALKMSEENGDEAGKALALHRIGLTLFRQGKLDEARKSLTEALTLRKKIGDRGGQSASLNTLGNILLRAGMMDDARERYEESLVICREIGDRLGIAACLNNLGYLASVHNDYKKAVGYLSEALATKREIGDRRGQVAATVNLAEAYFQLGKVKEALEFGEEAKRISEEINFVTGIVEGGFLIGKCLALNKQFPKAHKEIKTAIETAESANLTEEVFMGRLALADVLKIEGKGEEAEKMAREVYEASREKNIQSVAKEALKRLSK